RRSRFHDQGSTATHYEGRRLRLCPARHDSSQSEPFEESGAIDRAEYHGQGQASDRAGTVAACIDEFSFPQKLWMNDGQAYSPPCPPCKGGVAAALIKSREATEAPQTGWSVRRNV